MRNALVAAACCLSMLLGAPAAKASIATDKTIANIQVLNANSTGTVHVAIISLQISGNPSGRPSCHNGLLGTYWAIDLSTNKGRAMLSVATAAYLAGKQISIQGFSANVASSCIATGGPYNNIEGISNLQLGGL